MSMTVRSVAGCAALAVALSPTVRAQEPATRGLATGLTVEAGLGAIALRDRFISQERYSGSLPRLQVAWTRVHGGPAFHMTLEVQRSSSIRNYNVAATITQVSLRQGFLYPLRHVHPFSRNAQVFIGPTAELFVFMNEQRIAVANPNFAESVAGLLSLGISSRIAVPLGGGFDGEGAARIGVLSLGLRVVDTEVHDVSPTRILTPLSGLNLGASLGIRRHIRRHVSASLTGTLHVLRVSAWDPLTAVSNHVALGLTAVW